MAHEKEAMPKNVQKLIKKLADIQRKEIALLHSGVESGKAPRDVRKKMDELFESGNKAITELMETRFAVVELGIGWDEDADAVDEMNQFGSYFLGLYSMERMSKEISGEKYDEDLFYAGMLLMHRAMLLDEALDEDMDDEEEDDLDEMLDLIEEEFGDAPEKPDAKIVPLFGKKKDKKK